MWYPRSFEKTNRWFFMKFTNDNDDIFLFRIHIKTNNLIYIFFPFQNEIMPFRWIEHMEVKCDQKPKDSSIVQEKSDLHYTSYDPEKSVQ